MVALAMVVAVIAAAYFIFISANFNIDFGSSSTESSDERVSFTVTPGEDLDTIAENLKEKGVIDSPFFFGIRARLAGADDELKAGDFQLKKGMDTDELIAALTTSPLEQGFRFTVIEGMRLTEIAEKLSSEGIVNKDTFLQVAGTAEGAATFNGEFLAASGKPPEHNLEGYLFPDTYEIKKNEGDSSEAVIRAMLETMASKFTPEMRQRIAERNLSIHQVLTMASIVQREGQAKSELSTISAVYWNRFDIGMKLDADPTVQFGLGTEENWWPEPVPEDYQLDHPYNTYLLPTLPPGPICAPGLEAINAAIFPEQNDYLFFVAKMDGTGEHLFATTLEEHEQNRVRVGNR
jgi:UPF0755 protein